MQLQKKTIVVVDDSPSNIQIIVSALRPHYHVRPFTSGRECIQYFAKDQHADLILLDIEMPDLSGFDTIRILKNMPQAKSIPVIFLTGRIEQQSEIKGLSLGAVDYVYKPFNPALVLKRIEIHIALEEYNTHLQALVERKTQTIEKLNHVLISTVISLVGTRDQETRGHISRTSEYVVALAKRLREIGKHTDLLTDENIQTLWSSAPLHDVGKIGIPDSVLNKPGKLTTEEFEIMKRHTIIGGEAFEEARRMMNESSFLDMAEILAMYHHEKWDGTGYPSGLAREQIPLFARIMAVADVYDALISKRPYKMPISHEQAVFIILEGRGKHFDPDLADAFEAVQEHFREIAQRFNDDVERSWSAS